MIILTPARSLEVLLAAGVATNELPIVASYVDVQTSDQAVVAYGSADTISAGTAAVTAVFAPDDLTTRTVKSLSIYNADTTGATILVRLNNGVTTRTLIRQTIDTLGTLEYTDAGWHIPGY